MNKKVVGERPDNVSFYTNIGLILHHNTNIGPIWIPHEFPFKGLNIPVLGLVFGLGLGEKITLLYCARCRLLFCRYSFVAWHGVASSSLRDWLCCVTLQVTFCPTAATFFQQDIVMLCDNCHVKEFSLEGNVGVLPCSLFSSTCPITYLAVSLILVVVLPFVLLPFVQFDTLYTFYFTGI